MPPTWKIIKDAKTKELQDGILERKAQLANTTDQKEADRLHGLITHWEKCLQQLRNGKYIQFLELVLYPLFSDRESKRVDIIILKYKLPRVEMKCMNAIIKHTDWPHKVTWYDNRNQTANFSKIWNRLAHESTCDYVLIADSDAYVSPKWLSRMMSSFEPGFRCKKNWKEDAETVDAAPVGVVVPVTKEGAAASLQGTNWWKDDKRPFLTNDQMSGFFFLFRKSLLDDVGYFDERFYLHGQDSEWMDRIIQSQWNIVVRPDVFVDHETSASITKSREEGEIDYNLNINHTRVVYDVIREEKRDGIYEPPKYENHSAGS